MPCFTRARYLGTYNRGTCCGGQLRVWCGGRRGAGRAAACQLRLRARGARTRYPALSRRTRRELAMSFRRRGRDSYADGGAAPGWLSCLQAKNRLCRRRTRQAGRSRRRRRSHPDTASTLGELTVRYFYSLGEIVYTIIIARPLRVLLDSEHLPERRPPGGANCRSISGWPFVVPSTDTEYRVSLLSSSLGTRTALGTSHSALGTRHSSLGTRLFTGPGQAQLPTGVL